MEEEFITGLWETCTRDIGKKGKRKEKASLPVQEDTSTMETGVPMSLMEKVFKPGEKAANGRIKSTKGS